ncbi:hypothetical protein ANCCAN_16074 [Ancylostoma caninum]|uniref:7TM GPCR serpentine receptor class x (Srx) domain-containing protein n=2 Tax=Ancylostoma caninum TaxID=29170 RepID=A0A368G5T8_ANCCA|nr:hypothetical protein ANCCAN_16074 [Ancylostoma caninum]
MEQQTSMLRMNIRFYVQGCIGSAVIILAYTSLRIVSPLAKTRMQLFLATTLLMEIVHMCDGIILVAFNKHFRDIVLQPQRLFKKT